jgi:hypothetical protein
MIAVETGMWMQWKHRRADHARRSNKKALEKGEYLQGSNALS